MKREPIIVPNGMWLTDGILYAKKKVFLEVGRNADEFYLISDEEYRNLIQQEVNADGGSEA